MVSTEFLRAYVSRHTKWLVIVQLLILVGCWAYRQVIARGARLLELDLRLRIELLFPSKLLFKIQRLIYQILSVLVAKHCRPHIWWRLVEVSPVELRQNMLGSLDLRVILWFRSCLGVYFWLVKPRIRDISDFFFMFLISFIHLSIWLSIRAVTWLFLLWVAIRLLVTQNSLMIVIFVVKPYLRYSLLGSFHFVFWIYEFFGTDLFILKERS